MFWSKFYKCNMSFINAVCLVEMWDLTIFCTQKDVTTQDIL